MFSSALIELEAAARVRELRESVKGPGNSLVPGFLRRAPRISRTVRPRPRSQPNLTPGA